MGVKISALPSVSVPALTDVFPIVQAGVTYKETCTQLAALIGGSIAPNVLGTANQVIVTPGVGNVTLSTPQDIATTSNVTFGSVAFSPTTKGIVGTPTNNNAASGFVGEFITSNIPLASATSLVNATAKDITSISLTAGDWDVSGNVTFLMATGTTINNLNAWTSTTSATGPDGSRIAGVAYPNSATAWTMNAATSIVTPLLRVSVSTTTTVYLTAAAYFSVSTITGAGTISARRIR